MFDGEPSRIGKLTGELFMENRPQRNIQRVGWTEAGGEVTGWNESENPLGPIATKEVDGMRMAINVSSRELKIEGRFDARDVKAAFEDAQSYLEANGIPTRK
jgi:hypothetical protein